MDYAEIKEILARPSIASGEKLELLREITRHVNNAATHHDGRDLVIRALAVAEWFNESERALLMTLVRNVGLFPYLAESISKADVADQLAFELHRPDSPDSKIVFHSLQARIYHELMRGANVVLSASTSSGKSLIIDEMVASGKFLKVAIVVPTLALIDETRRRLLQRFGERCAVITHPSQKAQQDRTTVYVLTQERILSRDDLADVSFFVIDEFYKMNLSTEREPTRAVDLNLAFHKLAKTGAQFYLLGPNIQAIKGLDAYEHLFIPSEFSTVAVDVVHLNLPTRGTERDEGLVRLCKSIDGPTIIYCQSPGSASSVAQLLIDRCGLPAFDVTAPAVQWIGERYDTEWIVGNALRHGIGIHHGGVPRALQQYFIRLFNARQIPFLVCTSTIIEGVNTVAKNVIVYDRRKSRDVLEHFTYKNIEGRAGRMNQYFVGKVFVLEVPPEDKTFTVEFPLGVQSESTPMSLLLNLPHEDLQPLSQQRVSDLFQRSSLQPQTLRANRHIALEIQEAIAAEMRDRLPKIVPVLNWTQPPTGPQLEGICDLIYRFLSNRGLQEYRIVSGAQLAWHLNALRMEKDLSGYIKTSVERRYPSDTPSEAVENALRLVRNIVCQRFPRDLMVIDALQKDVLSENGIQPGDYTFFADQAENLFMPSVLFALDEYGIPIQTARALESNLMPATSLDEVLQRFRGLRLDTLKLAPFEKEILYDVRQTLFPHIEAASR
jgi:hypothetical protein